MNFELQVRLGGVGGWGGRGGLNSMTFTEDDLQKVTCLGAGFDLQEL